MCWPSFSNGFCHVVKLVFRDMMPGIKRFSTEILLWALFFWEGDKRQWKWRWIFTPRQHVGAYKQQETWFLEEICRNRKCFHYDLLPPAGCFVSCSVKRVQELNLFKAVCFHLHERYTLVLPVGTSAATYFLTSCVNMKNQHVPLALPWEQWGHGEVQKSPWAEICVGTS